jgi:hypothetical protein
VRRAAEAPGWALAVRALRGTGASVLLVGERRLAVPPLRGGAERVLQVVPPPTEPVDHVGVVQDERRWTIPIG